MDSNHNFHLLYYHLFLSNFPVGEGFDPYIFYINMS
jgi:hypothetical protein